MHLFWERHPRGKYIKSFVLWLRCLGMPRTKKPKRWVEPDVEESWGRREKRLQAQYLCCDSRFCTKFIRTHKGHIWEFSLIYFGNGWEFLGCVVKLTWREASFGSLRADVTFASCYRLKLTHSVRPCVTAGSLHHLKPQYSPKMRTVLESFLSGLNSDFPLSLSPESWPDSISLTCQWLSCCISTDEEALCTVAQGNSIS